MATKNATVDFESLDTEELLKKEQEFKQFMAQIAEAKAKREQQTRGQAFEEINTVLQKYVGNDNVIKPQMLLEHLVANKFIETIQGGRGRPASTSKNEGDELFTMPYKNEGGQREMTLRLSKDSKMPSPASGAATQLKALQRKSFDEIKSYFTDKFEEFKKNDKEACKTWVKTFFPEHQIDIFSEATA